MADGSEAGAPGRRKDGRPFKAGNTREDGSYAVGKSRPPSGTQFAKDDGRPRGRRPKGTRNLATDWQQELAETIEVNEGGQRKRITKQRGIVKATASRAMKGSDRAAEIAFRYSVARDQAAGRLLVSDEEIIRLWLAQQPFGQGEPKLSDDFDAALEPASSAPDSPDAAESGNDADH